MKINDEYGDSMELSIYDDKLMIEIEAIDPINENILYLNKKNVSKMIKELKKIKKELKVNIDDFNG